METPDRVDWKTRSYRLLYVTDVGASLSGSGLPVCLLRVSSRLGTNFWQSGSVRRLVGLLARYSVQTESLSTHRESQTHAKHERVFNLWSRCSRDRNGTYLKTARFKRVL